MNKSQHIHLNSGILGNLNDAKYFTVRLEQDVETLEFMSMTLRTKDVYQNFNADYGVLVGRVLANGGIGVPNAKVSIFIPITDEDLENPDIYKLYPYTNPRDKNNEGKRYNLLPRVSKIDPDDGQVKPKQAFGSFPIKEEIVTNETFLQVYKKYYKYTTTTNKAGDYMIFGVPVGTQTVHLSVDITDIGKYSMNAASMVVNLGYPESSFTNRNTRIKETTDLTDLPHIETQEISVDIRPFWGDTENFEIGITRQDFRIRAVLTNTFTLFGTSFTDNPITMRGSADNTAPNQREIRDFFTTFPNVKTETSDDNEFSNALANKRVSEVKEKIYYYPSDMTDAEISNANPIEDMMVLEKSQYSIYRRNGDFAFIINCNRDKVITSADGTEIPTNYDNPNGVFTTFRGFITLEYTVDGAPMTSESYIDKSTAASEDTTRTLPLRLRYKFPQHANKNNSFDYNPSSSYTNNWRKEHMKFEAQKFYSISTFIPAIRNNNGSDTAQWNKVNSFFGGNKMNLASDDDIAQTIGPIIVKNSSGYNNSNFDMVGNVKVDTVSNQRFGANWLNLCVYFPQIGYLVNSSGRVQGVRVADYLAEQYEDDSEKNEYFVFDNAMPIAGGDVNAKWFGRSDIHWTDIIEVPLSDIIKFKAVSDNGFRDNVFSDPLEGEYRNGNTKPDPTPWKGTWSTECPFNGGRKDGNPSLTTKDPLFYFYKGFSEADCIDWLYDLGLVT